MNNTTSKVFEQLSVIFTAAEDALSQWEGEGNLQFPTLMATLASKFAWTDKQVREVDPIVRYYVRHSDDWHITRGAKGGIMRSSDKNKKQEAVKAKEELKRQMKAKIETQAASKMEEQKSEEPEESMLEEDTNIVYDQSDMIEDESEFEG